IEQLLPVGANPQRLGLSDDGTRLYALLGTNTLVRWNLVTGSNDLTLSLPGESVLDFVALPGSATSFVLATTARVAVFDNLVARADGFNAAMDRRYLGYAGGMLWVAEPGLLRPFSITGNGLSAGTPIAFTLFSDYYRFASDGRNLFFSGTVFDTVTRQRINS